MQVLFEQAVLKLEVHGDAQCNRPPGVADPAPTLARMPIRLPSRLPKVTQRHLSELRGATRLAADATLGLADLVEAMHQRIVTLPGAAQDGRVTGILGISGLVYKSIRGVTRLVGGSLDALLAAIGRLTPMLQSTSEPVLREREALLAALNGVLGDHLVASGNPLATAMSLRDEGRALALDAASLRAALPAATGRLVLLVHGLCMNDLQWQRDGHDHGAMLARELGFTPVYLRYNSGQHVHTNGAEMARLIEQLLAAWPVPLQRVVLLCHSMGGLLARSAMHQGDQAGQAWPTRVDELVFLGTPHHGAPLERAGHGLDILLGAAPYAAPLARLGRVRSAGITDLRHGNLLPPRPAANGGLLAPASVPLPAHPRCYALAAQLGQTASALKGRVLGDGLVPVASALGQHAQAARVLAFTADRQAVLQGVSHLGLLSRPEVAEQLLRWLR